MSRNKHIFKRTYWRAVMFNYWLIWHKNFRPLALKHRRNFAYKIIKLIYLQNILFCNENILEGYKTATCHGESLLLSICYDILLILNVLCSPKTNRNIQGFRILLSFRLHPPFFQVLLQRVMLFIVLQSVWVQPPPPFKRNRGERRLCSAVSRLCCYKKT